MKKKSKVRLFITIALICCCCISLVNAFFNSDSIVDITKIENVSYTTVVKEIKSHELSEIKISGNKDDVTAYIKDENNKTQSVQTAKIPDMESFMNVISNEIDENGYDIEVIQEKNNAVISFLIKLVIFFFAIRIFISFIDKKSLDKKMKLFKGDFTTDHVSFKEKCDVSFKDVAGLDEELEEFQEIIDMLKFPEKYQKMGIKIPRGLLLTGNPGTGKTLVAKAMASEVDANFYKISGSDFVEKFVGVGASRVRELFSAAKEKTPSIIFIDEIDAIGKRRDKASDCGGNEEREQTLNQLLVEMDGFNKNSNVIVIAATNRPDVLDPALVRPGRFDRKIPVRMPDRKSREKILKVHSKDKCFAENVSIEKIAAITSNFSGAELANLLNEAAIFAARNNRTIIEKEDVMEAIRKVCCGLTKKSRIISKCELDRISTHEIGHGLENYYNGEELVQEISIIGRGNALGYTMSAEKEEKVIMTKEEICINIQCLLGGRAAEEVIYKNISSGAADDLERATKIALQMVKRYGMTSKKSSSISLLDASGCSILGEGIEREADKEISEILKQQYEKTKALLESKKDLIIYLKNILLEEETIPGEKFYEYIKEYELKSQEEQKNNE